MRKIVFNDRVDTIHIEALPDYGHVTVKNLHSGNIYVLRNDLGRYSLVNILSGARWNGEHSSAREALNDPNMVAFYSDNDDDQRDWLRKNL